MVWVIFSVCFFVALFWYLMFNGFKPNRDPFSFYGFWETLFGSAGLAFMVFLVGFLIALVLSVVWEDAPVEVISSTDYKIVALQDNFGLEGNFFLGSGYIDDELSYTYMHYVEGRGYKAETVDASNALNNFLKQSYYPNQVTVKDTKLVLNLNVTNNEKLPSLPDTTEYSDFLKVMLG